MKVLHMPSTVPLQPNHNMGDFLQEMQLSGDMGANGRSFYYSFRHNSSRQRYDQHQEQSLPQQQREKELRYQKHLDNKSKKKYTNNNKQTASETIGVNHVKVKSEMACGTSDTNRNNNSTTNGNERKRSFQQHSSGSDTFTPDQDTQASSKERLAKKQRTEISFEIVHEPNNATNLKVTTTIESGSSGGKRENGIQSDSNQSFVSGVLDIRHEHGEMGQSQQDDLLGSSSDIGDILDSLGKQTGEKTDLIKLIEQGDIEKLMKTYGGNDIEQMLNKIIDESNQELQQCTTPAVNLGGKGQGEVKEEGAEKSQEGLQVVPKTEHNPPNINQNRQIIGPPNMNVTDAFPTTQALPSIHELKKPATSSAMPPSSVFNNQTMMKVEGGRSNQSVPSGMFPSNSVTTMPITMSAASTALSDMAVSSSSGQQATRRVGAIVNVVQQQPNNNTLVSSTMNQMSNMYGGAQFPTTQQSSPASHLNNSMNSFSSATSSHGNNLAQILKQGIPARGNAGLPSLPNAFQKGLIRPPGGSLNNSPYLATKNRGGYPNTRLTPEQYKILMRRKQLIQLQRQQQQQQQLQQQQQHQQQQAMNPLIRAPPPPYKMGAANMGYPRTMPMGHNMGMQQQRMSMGGIPQDSMNPGIHLGNPQTLQHQQQPQMTAQMAAQHARTSGMRQLLQPGQMAASRLQNMMRPARMASLREHLAGGQMMSMQQPMRRNPMGAMMNNPAAMQPQQMNPGLPNMGGGNHWQGPVQTLNSMQAMQQPQSGMGLQPNSGMNQFQGMGRNSAPGLQTVVNVQTNQNAPQNLNIQTSVPTHTVLHQQQQPGFSNAAAAMNNQRLQQLHQLQSQMNRATPGGGGAMPPMGGVPPSTGQQGNMMVNAATGRPQNTVQSSSQLDLDILNNIISKETS